MQFVRLSLTLCITAVLARPALAAEPDASSAARPPHIIFVFADDLGWGDVGFNGRKTWSTPNLDRLAAQGTKFNRWYAAATVCAPSRATLMTGRYTIHCGVSDNGADLPAAEVTIAEALKARGYATALFGKWHHGRPRGGAAEPVHPMDQGFDEFVGFRDARHAWEHFPRNLWFGRERRPFEGYALEKFTDLTIDFLDRHRQQPCFVYLSYNAPHFYVEAPAEDVAAFAGKFEEKDPADPVNATYAASIVAMDRQVGRLMKALDDAGLAENTLLVFTSDHGATFEAGPKGAASFHDSNYPFRGQKRTLYEGGIRVPGVVRWPGKVPAGKVSHDLVHMTDVFPTLLAAAGAEPDPAWKVDGVNLLPVWTGRGPAPERTVFWEWQTEGHNQLAAMRGDMKLIVVPGNSHELYNVETDPAERRNLAAEQPKLVQRLNDELKAWLATESDAAKENNTLRRRKQP